jgi:uracil-DNA glycosylase family 4
MSCTKCDLHTKCDNVKIDSRSDKAPIMIVLEGPNKGDDRAGKILASDTYLKFQYFLERCGLKEEDVYVTYAVKCFTGKKISDIKPKHIKACNPYLQREIKKVKPKVIIAAGKAAFQSLTGETSVDDFRGHFRDFSMTYTVEIGESLKEKEFKTKIMPTFSIDGSMFAWVNDDYIIHDIKKAMKFADTGKHELTPIPKWEIITDIDRLEKVAEYLSKQKYTFFDTETTGLYFYKNEIVNVGFAANKNKVFIWYMNEVPREHMKKYEPEEIELMTKINLFTKKYKSRIVAATAKIMASDSKKIAHNIKFDLKFLNKEGCPTNNIYFDTMVADALIDENKRHDLNSCMEYRGFDFGPYDTNLWPYVNKDKKNKKPYSYVPPTKLSTYLAIDVGGLAMMTPRIFKELKHPKVSKNEAMFKLMFEQQMPLVRLLYEMELDGFHADVPFLDEMGIKIGKIIEKTKKRFEELTNNEVSISSPDQVSKYLESKNYPFDKVNAKKGAKGYSVDKKTLNAFVGIKKYRRIPALIIKYRELSKLKSTYLDGSDGEGGLKDMVSSEGKFHTSFNLHIARTGRLSSSNPNCLSIDTEILTASGWRDYKSLGNLDVFQYNLDNEYLDKVKPNGYYISELKEHEMTKVDSDSIDLKITQNHRCLFQNRKSGKYVVQEAKDWKNDYKILHAAKYSEGIKINKALLAFICAVQADGSYRRNNNQSGGEYYLHVIDFVFKKPRKIKRLEKILKVLKLDYVKKPKKRSSGDLTCFIVQIPEKIQKILQHYVPSKIFDYTLMELDYESRIFFLNEIRLWDGLSTRKPIEYTSIVKKNHDVIQAISSITGYRCTIGYHSKHTDLKPVYTSYAKNRNYSLTANNEVKHYTEKNIVWCISVPSGFIVTRRNGKVAIIGNCQNIPNKSGLVSVRNAFIPPEDQVVWECDFSQLELRVIAFLAHDRTLIKEFQSGDDMHSKNAVMFGHKLEFIDKNTTLEEFLKVYNYVPPENWREIEDKDKLKEIEDKIEQQRLAKKIRNLAKKIAFGLNYGIEVPTVAEEFGLENEQVQDAFDVYFNKYKAVDEFSNSRIDVVMKRGYLELPMTGRRRRFTQVVRWLRSEYGQEYYARRYLMSEIERQAKNFEVQGFANEIYVKAKLKLANMLKRHVPTSKLRLTIHDGMVNTGYLKDMKKVEKVVAKSFYTVLGEGRWSIPLTSDFEVFTRWEGDKIDHKKA